MTTIDPRFDYCELLLQHENPAQVPAPSLPESYAVASDPLAYRDAWVALMGELRFPGDLDEHRAHWAAMAETDPELFSRYSAFVVDGQGDLAATCSLWPGRHFSPERLRIHWVMTSPSHQRKGLARVAVAECCRRFAADKPGEPLYLSTQAQSWPAIRLYESMGFAPYEGAWSDRTAEQSAADWAEARRLVREVAGAEV